MRKEQPVTDNKKDSANVALIRIAYHESDSGESTEVTLDPVVFVGIVHIMRTLGQEHARAVLQFGATLVKSEFTAVDTQRLDHVLTAVERYIAQWEDPADLALALSYEQLRKHQLTDAQVALSLPRRFWINRSAPLSGGSAWTSGPQRTICRRSTTNRSSGVWTTRRRDERQRDLGADAVCIHSADVHASERGVTVGSGGEASADRLRGVPAWALPPPLPQCASREHGSGATGRSAGTIAISRSSPRLGSSPLCGRSVSSPSALSMP